MSLPVTHCFKGFFDAAVALATACPREPQREWTRMAHWLRTRKLVSPTSEKCAAGVGFSPPLGLRYEAYPRPCHKSNASDGARVTAMDLEHMFVYCTALRDGGRMGLFDNESDISIVFAFGRSIQMTPLDRPPGLISTLHTELVNRNLWVELVMSMTAPYARSLLLAVQMDKAAAAKLNRV